MLYLNTNVGGYFGMKCLIRNYPKLVGLHMSGHHVSKNGLGRRVSRRRMSGRQVSKIFWESYVWASGVQYLSWASSVRDWLGVTCPK